MFGHAGAWGYVTGGIGVVSFLLCDIARDAGAVVATGVPVGRILPGRGVELEGGELIRSPVVISNADPRTSLQLLDDGSDAGWQERVESIPMEGCTVKANILMSQLPDFSARPGVLEPHHHGQVNTPLTGAGWRSAFLDASAGNLPKELWTELYFQTAGDATIAPEGKHVVSVFAQYVPYQFNQGTWDDMRDEVRGLILSTLAKFCTNIPDAVVEMQIQGPPDIERKVGLHGGHIFQGECLPACMWDRRLTCRTPMDGFYLCGAGTHPGGSVIAVNGRNAAMAVLEDFA
jgi:phytoene dehydrogenase-like protein